MDYPGWWNDGQTARRTPVRVRLLGRRLTVSDGENDRILAELPVERLQLAEEVYAGQPVRLKHDEWPDARLTVNDPALMDKLAAAEPRLLQRFHARRATAHRLMVWGGALLATVAALVATVQFGAEPLASMMPLEWEERLGETTMADFIKHYGACDEDAGVAHVQALAEEIAQGAGSPYRFRVHILQGKEVNAFVLPGGRIAVFQGLLQEARGPNELAGVLAHEVAHGIARHPVEQMLRHSGYSLLATLITGDLSGFAILAGDAAAFIASMANSRADETEADRVAVGLLNEAGIDSHGLPEFFGKIGDAERRPPQTLTLVSTHPANEERLRMTRALARPGRDALPAEAWQAVRKTCAATEG